MNKNALMFVLAWFMYGNLAYAESASAILEGLLHLARASDGSGRESLILVECQNNCTSECAALNDAILAAVNHTRQSDVIKSHERMLRRMTDQENRKLFEAAAIQEKSKLPGYGKSYWESLSLDGQQRLEDATTAIFLKHTDGKLMDMNLTKAILLEKERIKEIIDQK